MDDKIVVVDDDPGTVQLIGRILQGVGDLRFATSGEKALQLVHDSTPDLVLLDAELPGVSGFKVFETLRSEPQMLGVPIIFITSHNDTGFEVSALNMGAADYIAKPFTPAKLLARVNTHLRNKRNVDELRRTSSSDTLTCVGSRHQFDESLEREWRRGLRVGDPMALLLVEVDHFTQYNERYGHINGGICLQRVAKAIRAVTRRPADLVARRGGEQFAVLLPQTRRRGAEHIAHRLMDSVEAQKITHEGSVAIHHVTASIGAACFDEESSCWPRAGADFRFRSDSRKSRVANNLLLAADKALHSARLAGHAHAKLLDIAGFDAPFLTRHIESMAREEHSAKWA
jgi:diguanylate cyclase (GGDEF)-like protein